MATDLEVTDHEERRRSEAVLWRILPYLSMPGPGGDSGGSPRIEEILHHPEHSNDLLEVRVRGRRLMIKRGVDPWSEDRFRGARRAARLLRSRGGITAPRYLDVPDVVDGWPVLTWWRIPSTTLARVWGSLPDEARAEALRSWGALLARVHEIPVEGWGPLSQARENGHDAGDFFEQDLGERLRRAAYGCWRDAVPLVKALIERIPDVKRHTGDPCLVHSDAHLSNVLCETHGEQAQCVGMLDLEAVSGGAPEMDLSYIRLVHSPLMAGDLGDGWTDHVLEGYGKEPDRELMEFFAVYHLLNVGIHTALTGWTERAEQLSAAGKRMLDGAGPP